MKKILLIMLIFIFIFSLLIVTGCEVGGEEVTFWEWLMSFFAFGS
jgi:hypothetical protein